jgi:2-haloacid dehalogenase
MGAFCGEFSERKLIMNRPDMSKYKILFMDADNTLLDFSKAEAQALAEVFRKYNVCKEDMLSEVISKFSEINDALWKRLEKKEVTREYIIANRFKDTFEFFGIYYSAEMGIEEEYFSSLCFQYPLIEGAEAVCRELSENYDLYIITNGTKKIQDSRMAGCGLLPYFKGVFISQELGVNKPAKEYFDKVFEAVTKLSGPFDKSEVLVVGDSVSSDIKGAVNAELDGCWYNPDGKALPKNFDELAERSELSGRKLYEISRLEELLAK